MAGRGGQRCRMTNDQRAYKGWSTGSRLRTFEVWNRQCWAHFNSHLWALHRAALSAAGGIIIMPAFPNWAVHPPMTDRRVACLRLNRKAERLGGSLRQTTDRTAMTSLGGTILPVLQRCGRTWPIARPGRTDSSPLDAEEFAMNGVEWIAHARGLGGVNVPMDVLTPVHFREWSCNRRQLRSAYHG